MVKQIIKQFNNAKADLVKAYNIDPKCKDIVLALENLTTEK